MAIYSISTMAVFNKLVAEIIADRIKEALDKSAGEYEMLTTSDTNKIMVRCAKIPAPVLGISWDKEKEDNNG